MLICRFAVIASLSHLSLHLREKAVMTRWTKHMPSQSTKSSHFHRAGSGFSAFLFFSLSGRLSQAEIIHSREHTVCILQMNATYFLSNVGVQGKATSLCVIDIYIHMFLTISAMHSTVCGKLLRRLVFW